MARIGTEPPTKRARFFDDSDGENENDGVQLNGNENGFKLKVNEDFAKRFEHNKKREEQHKLEEKLGKDGRSKRKRDEEDEEEDESSTDESEDDDAELATADVDDEIMATLQAIRNKDPRVYDQSVKFFREYDPEATTVESKKEKPMYLQDYHRQNLLSGNAGGDDQEEEPRRHTYAEEQEQMKRELVGSMHAGAGAADNDEDEEEDNFLVAKKQPKHESLPPMKKTKKITDEDVKTADKDPETYLSNFMAARAWLPGDGSRFQAFDSDDSDEDKRADEFEEAYNMRFEDPQKANEKLQSFARDVGKYGVRRDEKSGRAKARERERERKDAERQERQEDKARLRKLKIEEAEQKVKRIKEAAGLQGQELDLQEWRDVIDGDFDDDKWEQEMKRRFGEDYYAKDDAEFGSEDDEDQHSRSRKPKKPKWDDDIDIGDLVPDFEKEGKAEFTLTDDEDEEGGAPLPANGEDEDEDDDEGSRKKKTKTKKDREKEKMDARRAARKERMKIEEIVDASMPLHDPTLNSAAFSKAPVVGFRYRETSPTSFGLSARDILFADDSALNSFAGLKKMAAFRDPEKKRRDKKKFSKKARLRQWRKETFGKTDEPTGGFERVLGDVEATPGGEPVGDASRRKKKRKNKKTEDKDNEV